MRLLTTLSSTHWLCTAETVSPVIEKTVLLGTDIILALRTHMRTLGLINHIHHWTWNWQSQTNLVGTAPPFALWSSSPWSIPSHSLCLHRGQPGISKLHQVWESMLLWEKYGCIFFCQNIVEIGWKGRRCKSLPIYGKQRIFPLKWFPSPRTMPAQSWTVTNVMQFSVWLLHSQILPRRWGNTKKYIFSVLLTWAWKLLSAVIELK